MRHIVSLSGGKDSTAMTLLLNDQIPDLELVFMDTGRELPEVYTYLDQIEKVLQKPIKRIQYCGRDFDWYLREFNYLIPDKVRRWCTKQLKIIPFERYIGRKSDCIVYLGIRVDEERVGHLGLRDNVEYRYPLRQQGVDKQGVYDILNRYDVQLPTYYKWRSTGGCWCCPFQRKSDWAGLRKFHPELFDKAVNDEIKSAMRGTTFTWNGNSKPLTRLEASWQPPLILDEWEADRPCVICAK